jgi:hypothetical protein
MTTKREGNHKAYEGEACSFCGHDLLDHIIRPTNAGYRIGCIHPHPQYYPDNCECNAGIETKGDKGRDGLLTKFLEKIK